MTKSLIPSFDDLPDSAYIRISHLVRDPKYPDRATPVPFSVSTLWRHIGAGTFPQPVRLSRGVIAFKVSEIRAWLTLRHSAALALVA